MPLKRTIARAHQAKRRGKSASTQAGEFVREEIEQIRAGKHGARSAKQAIAIGLSKARRAGVELPVPEKDKASAAVRRKARQDLAKGKSSSHGKVSRKRSLATTRALKREGRAAASHAALSRQTRKASARRTKAERSASARKAARTRAKSAA